MNKRQSNIELLRGIAMLLIITGHLLGDNGGCLLQKSIPYSLQWYLLWAIEAFCVAGTNCFILISGYFAVDSYKEITLSPLSHGGGYLSCAYT